jgi:hypothetical protein
MVDYLGSYNAPVVAITTPACGGRKGTTVTEAPTYQTKLGIRRRREDILVNHPNDNVSLIFFSSPRSSAGATGLLQHHPRADGKEMIASLINSAGSRPR